jgi:hypothetical protein
MAMLCISFMMSLPELKAQPLPGYNRFQYHNYRWKVLHTGAFHIYFPSGNDSLCRFASVQLPDIAEEVKRAMGFTLRQVPNLIIYPSPDQLYESNVGRSETTAQTFPDDQPEGQQGIGGLCGVL